MIDTLDILQEIFQINCRIITEIVERCLRNISEILNIFSIFNILNALNNMANILKTWPILSTTPLIILRL